MKQFTLTCCAVLMFAALASAQNHGTYGIGLRAGDPFGISIIEKKSNHAFELSAGLASFAGIYNYYEKNFDRWRGFNDFEFKDYDKIYGFSIQLHYLRFREISDSLKWYYGGGGQIRFFKIWYEYGVEYYDIASSSNRKETWNATAYEEDMGIDGVIGIDYAFDSVPLSVFADLTLYVELHETHFAPLVQGGLGVRYNFY